MAYQNTPSAADYVFGETFDPNKPKTKPVDGVQYPYKPNGSGDPSRWQDFPTPAGGLDYGQNRPVPTPAAPAAPGTSNQPPAGTTKSQGGDWHPAVQQLFQTLPPTSQSLDQIIAAIPGSRRATHANGTLPSDDAVIMPDERIVDFIKDVGSANASWQMLEDSAGGGGGQGGGGGAYVPGQGVAGQGTIFGAGGQFGNAGANKLFETLMGRATQDLKVDPNDPLISRQVDAYNATQQRSQRNYESQLAERRGNNANMGAERRLGAEHIGSATSAFEAELMGRELNARRQEIQSALEGSRGMLTAQQQMMLQEELAQLGLAQGAYQFDVNDQFRNSPLGS